MITTIAFVLFIAAIVLTPLFWLAEGYSPPPRKRPDPTLGTAFIILWLGIMAIAIVTNL
jgi:hypothetical protein